MIRDLDVAYDISEALVGLDELARKQLPFVTALAITTTAKGARDDFRAGLDRKFVVRTPWIRRGIVMQAARKVDWPNVEGVVGTRDAFMEVQEAGGRKKAKQGRLGEPLGARPDKTDVVRRSNWPGRALKRPRTFVQTLAQGSRKGSAAVLRRQGAERYPLQVLFVLRNYVPVKPRLALREDVARYALESLPSRFREAWQTALRSAKDRDRKAAKRAAGKLKD